MKGERSDMDNQESTITMDSIEKMIKRHAPVGTTAPRQYLLNGAEFDFLFGHAMSALSAKRRCEIYLKALEVYADNNNWFLSNTKRFIVFVPGTTGVHTGCEIAQAAIDEGGKV